MVTKGVVFGHKTLGRGTDGDRAKVEAIQKFPYTRDIRGLIRLLGHAGFYRRFINDFSKKLNL
jgi:hypothetical protein